MRALLQLAQSPDFVVGASFSQSSHHVLQCVLQGRSDLRHDLLQFPCSSEESTLCETVSMLAPARALSRPVCVGDASETVSAYRNMIDILWSSPLTRGYLESVQIALKTWTNLLSST